MEKKGIEKKDIEKLQIRSWYETLRAGAKALMSELDFVPGAEGEAKSSFEAAGYHIEVKDILKRYSEGFRLIRLVRGTRISKAEVQDGIALGLEIVFDEEGKSLRYGIPSCCYSSGIQGRRSFMEDRLTAPFVMAYSGQEKEAYALIRTRTARYSEMEQRKQGDTRFLQRTDVGSVGHIWEYGKKNALTARWPYEEADRSVALDSSGTPLHAFYPLEEESWEVELEYEFRYLKGRNFTESLYQIFKDEAKRQEMQGHAVTQSAFTLEEEMAYREESLMKSYREFDRNGAGFFFHFDPKKGYGSEPSGFGTSFNTIPHQTYVHILEYGFTGRQNNAALILAKDKGGVWKERGRKVVDFFLEKCMTDSGWLYSLYDLEAEAPFYSFGDGDAPKLHYMDYTGAKGNYLRTMTEPMNDVLECYLWYRGQGEDYGKWLQQVKRFADFLLEIQNQDGSWYRAYEPDGKPVHLSEEGGGHTEHRERGRKAATAIPIVFLCNLASCCASEEKYLQAAVKAGEYLLSHDHKAELYQGGTLDNPNIVDKEAAQYAMAGNWHLYERTGEKRFLDGAVQAARQFATWNYIWNAPMRKGTILYDKQFCTKGMGAINSIWCGGVVDIYSLFHVRELYLTGQAAGDKFLMSMAGWISRAAHQIMSYPGDSMGFWDIGMQPEGFGICPQGMDEGMIQKGDIWGTLGWIYSAGIDGVKRYVNEIA